MVRTPRRAEVQLVCLIVSSLTTVARSQSVNLKGVSNTGNGSLLPRSVNPNFHVLLRGNGASGKALAQL